MGKYHHFQKRREWRRCIAASVVFFLEMNHQSAAEDRRAYIEQDTLTPGQEADDLLSTFVDRFLDRRYKDVNPPGSANSTLASDLGRFVAELTRHFIRVNGMLIAAQVAELILRYEGLEPKPNQNKSLSAWYDDMHNLDVDQANLVGRVAALIDRHWYYPLASRRTPSGDPYASCRAWAHKGHQVAWFDSLLN